MGADIDMKKIAEELKKQHVEPESLNAGHRKATFYIREDLYAAYEALCKERGDRKRIINEALEEYIVKRYKEMKQKE